MRSTLAMIAVLAATDATAATLTTAFDTGVGTGTDGNGVTDGFADDEPDPVTGRRSFYTLLNETGRSLFSSAPAALPDATQGGGSAIVSTTSGYRDVVGTVDTDFRGFLDFFAPERLTLEEARLYNPLPVLRPQAPLTVTSRLTGEIVAEATLAGQVFDFLPNDLDLVTSASFTNPSPAGMRREDAEFQNLVKVQLPGLRVLSGNVTIDSALKTETFWRSYEIDVLAVHRETGETQRRSFIPFVSSANAPFDLSRPGWWDVLVEDVRLNMLVEGDIDLTLAYGLGYSFGFGCGDSRTPSDNGELCVFDGVLNFLEGRLPLAEVRSEPDPQLRTPRPQAALFVEGDVGVAPAPVPLPPSILALMAALGGLAVAKRAGRAGSRASRSES
jgi:hypothetical protein